MATLEQLQADLVAAAIGVQSNSALTRLVRWQQPNNVWCWLNIPDVLTQNAPHLGRQP